MAMGGIIVAIHIQGPKNIHPRGVHGHQDHALLLVGGRARISLAHEDGNLAARIGRSTCPPLVSTHNVAVSFPTKSTSHGYIVCCWCLLLDAWTRHLYGGYSSVHTMTTALFIRWVQLFIRWLQLCSYGGYSLENSSFKVSWRPCMACDGACVEALLGDWQTVSTGCWGTGSMCYIHTA